MLIVTGTVAYDFIIDYPGKFSDHILPDQIHKINLSFRVEDYAKRRGGTAGNIVYNLHLLGVKSVLFSKAGKDFDEYKKYFEKIGISTKFVEKDIDNYTSTGFGITDKTDNQIWGYSFGAGSKMHLLNLSKVAKKNELVVIGPSGVKGTMSFVKQCVKNKLQYMFDPSFALTDLSDNDLLYGIKHSKYLIGNDYEISLIKKRLTDFKKIVTDKTVITTFGQKGSEIEANGNKIKIGVAKIKKIVDPTGAGDAWRSGFLAGLYKNFDLKTCGQMGAVTSAYAVEHYGTQEHIFTKTQFEKRYRQVFGNLIKL